MANDGGYQARNGAKDAPLRRATSDGMNLGDDFPVLCETCLGPNPYVRMVKLPYGQKLCKISNAPYQSFRWKAGPGGRYKETIISYAVAKERNICQTCLNDLQFGLPVGVRDKLLTQNSGSTQLALPQSDVGNRYFYEQQARLGENAQEPGFTQTMQSIAPTRQLLNFSRTMQTKESHNVTAFRNLPKLCSFWVAGSCVRVLKKSCPFRPCCGTYLFPEIAGSHKEECAKLIATLEANGPAETQKTLDNDLRIALKGAGKGSRDDAIKKRVTGEDDLSRKYLNKMQSMNMELTPPEDPSVCTLWVGNVEPDMVEADLYSVFFPYGTVTGIHIARASRCAFVEMGSRDVAEHAAKQLYNVLSVHGRPLTLHWARQRTPMDTSSSHNTVDGEGGGGSGSGVIMPAPPGMERVAPETYALPGMGLPSFRPPQPPPLPPGGARITGMTRQRELEAGDGDGDDDVPGGKRVNAQGMDMMGEQEQGQGQGQVYSQGPMRTNPRTVPTTMTYPSMDPLRMGTGYGTSKASGR
eukprot:gene12831-27056_t